MTNKYHQHCNAEICLQGPVPGHSHGPGTGNSKWLNFLPPDFLDDMKKMKESLLPQYWEYHQTLFFYLVLDHTVHLGEIDLKIVSATFE